MKNISFVAFLFSLLMLGCKDVKPEIREVGTFVSVMVAPTPFMDSKKSFVTTTEGVFTVEGFVSGMKGDRVYLRSKTNWSSCYLFVGKNKRGKYVLGM